MKFKKVFGLLLAMIMVFGLAVPAMAAENDKTNSVTVHKVVMSQKDLHATWTATEIEDLKKLPSYTGVGGTKDEAFIKAVDALEDGSSKWPAYLGQNEEIYKGVAITGKLDEFFGDTAKALPGVYFQWFHKDGTEVILQKTNDGYTYPDQSSNVTDGKDLTNAANGDFLYMGAKTDAEGKFKFDTSMLPDGDYIIREVHEKSTPAKDITGSKAVPVILTLPMVNEEGIIPDAEVYPKNASDKPGVDKNYFKEQGEGVTIEDLVESKDGYTEEEIGTVKEYLADIENYDKEKALVKKDVGEILEYDVLTTIKAFTTYQSLFWTDSMTKGLEFQPESFKVMLGEEELVINEDYVLNYTLSGFRAELLPAGLERVNNQSEDKEIHLYYTAKLTKEAVIDNPDSNEVSLNYDRFPDKGEESKPIKPENEKITVKKDWADGHKLPEGGITVIFDLFVKDAESETGWTLVETKALHITNETVDTDNLYTFAGLDNDKEYKVVERSITGYTAEFMAPTSGGDEQGTIQVVQNKPNPTTKPVEKKITLEKTFTNADQFESVTLTFDLYKKIEQADGSYQWKIVQTKTETFTKDDIQNGKEIEFTGLEEDADYKIEERASEFHPKYTETDAAGKLAINNDGDNPGPKPLKPTSPKVVTGGKKFVKMDVDSDERLSEAEFVIYKKGTGQEEGQVSYLVKKTVDSQAAEYTDYTAKQEQYDEIIKDYNDLASMKSEEDFDETLATEIKTKYQDEVEADLNEFSDLINYLDSLKLVVKQREEARDEALFKASEGYEWTPYQDPTAEVPEEAYKIKSNVDGQFEINGLAYGEYYLKEITAPEGYALKNDDTAFTIAKGTDKDVDVVYESDAADDAANNAKRVDNKQITIPPTGGIGTIIFTVAGLALMAIAIIAISKKRSDDLLEEN